MYREYLERLRHPESNHNLHVVHISLIIFSGYMRLTVIAIPVICMMLLLVSGGCTGNILPKPGARGLMEYRDNDNLFSISIPEHWTVSVGDAIVVC